VELSIDLASFYTNTTHKSGGHSIEFDGDLTSYQDAGLVARYGVQAQKRRVVDKAPRGRIAGRVNEWLCAAAYRYIAYARH
jgi:hypothetical protein